MRVLVVTEKCGAALDQRDGGARLVATLERALGEAVSMVQFGPACDDRAEWHFPYPTTHGDRFAQRLANAAFVAARVRELAPKFTHVAFVHISMQFGFANEPLAGVETWTFPMFLTPSYEAAGEFVPPGYFERERAALRHTTRVITPSHLERHQLVDVYGVDDARIRVVPRGVDLSGEVSELRPKGGPLVVVAVGSVKRQKNTLGLLRAFAEIRARHSDATLRVLGGIQDAAYASEALAECRRLSLSDSVDFVGHVAPSALPAAVASAHLHLSASHFETFGRSIFETLALGLPNVALAPGNAAATFLRDTPYARFVQQAADIPDAVDELLDSLPTRSAMAREVGALFDERFLSRLLVAELRRDEALVVSDWDGTLFHKDDSERTAHAVEAFRRRPRRVLCTARSVSSALAAIAEHRLDVDWIIGHSGAVLTNGLGRTVSTRALPPALVREMLVSDPCATLIEHEGEVVQVSTTLPTARAPLGCRAERYQDTTFVSHWESSKLQGVHRLLRHIDWGGRVRAWGDGVYDDELLTYFDGVRVRGKRQTTLAGLRTVEAVGDVDF